MAPHREALTLEAMDVESAPPLAAHHWPEKRSAELEDLRSRDLLKEAHQLLLQILTILNDPTCRKHSSASWSLRLARAHALTLLDHLARMVESR
jgi:hypothetical protein